MLRELVEKMDQLGEDIPNIEEEVEDDERVIGTLTGDLRKLYALVILESARWRRFNSDQVHEIIREAKRNQNGGGAKSPGLDHKTRKLQLKLRVLALGAVFRAQVVQEFPEIGLRDDYGVRKGYQLVVGDVSKLGL